MLNRVSGRLVLLIARRKALQQSIRNEHHVATPEQIAKVPPQFRNITYDDVPIPRGSWQARYDELQRKYNKFLAFSVTLFALTSYVFYQVHEFPGCPDEPAERWYPLDRFKDGDGSSVL